MPELPEVETITRALQPHLAGQILSGIKTYIDTMRYPLRPLHDPACVNREIVAVRRRGRYIIVELENQRAFIIHLGMSGSLRAVPLKTKRLKHEHVMWILENGMTIRFNCPRRFGFVKLSTLPAPGGDPPELGHLGVEPLDPEFSPQYLFDRTRKRTGAVKNLIMNNAVVVGIGNIYATEALFAARIAPDKPAGKLTRKNCELLTAAVKQILAKSIEVGGTTIADYKSVDGTEGKFVQQLQMYGQKDAPCPVCGTLIKQIKLGGRSSCFCPKCQK